MACHAHVLHPTIPRHSLAVRVPRTTNPAPAQPPPPHTALEESNSLDIGLPAASTAPQRGTTSSNFVVYTKYPPMTVEEEVDTAREVLGFASDFSVHNGLGASVSVV